MRQTFVIAGAAATATAYALALTTNRGRQFRREYTWLSVVVGVGATLAWAGLRNRNEALRILEMFAVTGTPIIFMCVAEDLEKHAEVNRLIRGK
jgi:ABC-type spermidine/putrescine transport system permease subunit II